MFHAIGISPIFGGPVAPATGFCAAPAYVAAVRFTHIRAACGLSESLIGAGVRLTHSPYHTVRVLL